MSHQKDFKKMFPEYMFEKPPYQKWEEFYQTFSQGPNFWHVINSKRIFFDRTFFENPQFLKEGDIVWVSKSKFDTIANQTQSHFFFITGLDDRHRSINVENVIITRDEIIFESDSAEIIEQKDIVDYFDFFWYILRKLDKKSIIIQPWNIKFNQSYNLYQI